jgi:hypothetical protein
MEVVPSVGNAGITTTMKTRMMMTTSAMRWITIMIGMMMKFNVSLMTSKIAGSAGKTSQRQRHSLQLRRVAKHVTPCVQHVGHVWVQKLKSAKSAGSVGTMMMTKTRMMTMTAMLFTRIMIGMMRRSSVCRGTEVIAGSAGAWMLCLFESLVCHSFFFQLFSNFHLWGNAQWS